MKLKSSWLILVIFIIVNLFFITLQELFPYNQEINSNWYAYLENISTKFLLSLVFTLLVIGTVMKYSHVAMTLILGTSLGALFFINILGLKMVDPTEINWVIRGDWEWHFMGWHFFRQEPWHWPIGKITNFFFSLGTSIGYTDSLPLFALLFKPFTNILPTDFQYIGLWLLVCYIFQGVFGALLIRLVSKNLLIQTVGTLFFVMNPVLLHRLGQNALCAHWLLLAGLWMYFKPWEKVTPIQPLKTWFLLISISALVHPYLTAMMLGLVTAFYARFWLIDRNCTIISAGLQLALLFLTTLLIWWQVGYFLIESENTVSSGLGHYSMNLLAPLNAMGGGSILFRDLPVATSGQYEGFNYLGAGILLMGIWVLYELNKHSVKRATIKKLLPLGVVCLGFTLFAVSNKVTIGSVVLIDFQSELLNVLAIFRSSGRFFWPVYYLLLFLIMSVLIVRNLPRTVFIYLSLGLTLQSWDLHPIYQSHYQVRDEPARHWNPTLLTWNNPLRSDLWERAALYYQHITLIPPIACGEPAAPYAPFAYLAGRYGMTINTGIVARFDAEKTRQYCETFFQDIHQGKVDDKSIYILHPNHLENFKKVAQLPLICAKIDGFDTCVTQRSFARWNPSL